jgi:hypothetical protein
MKLKEALESMTDEQIMGCVRLCNGHNILKPQALLEEGFPSKALPSVCFIHKSGSGYKDSIFDNDGNKVAEMSGVCGLDFLQDVARALGVKYRSAMGRGFRAGNIKSALKKHFDARRDS